MKVQIKDPNANDYRDAQVAYNKAFKEALESGAILKAKLKQYYKDQGIWDDKKEEQQNKLVDQIREGELSLKTGGIPLKKAKEIALHLRKLRGELQELVAEKQSFELNCAESQADNARFIQFVLSCIVKEDGTRVWDSLAAYEAESGKDWAVKAVEDLANKMYGINPNYNESLPENEFLKRYKFTDGKYRLINEDGHLVDDEGRLIDETGRYVAYTDDGEQYFVDKNGHKLTEDGELVVDFQPFLDDDGNPIPVDPEPVKPATTTKRRKKTTTAS